MKRLFYSMMIAVLAMLPVACETEPVSNTGDQEGILYGIWVLDTRTVDTETNVSGKNDTTHDQTDFTGDHFILRLTDFFMAFGQEGSVLTFDIDDVDGTPYTYNADTKKISFEKAITLSKGLFKIVRFSGTYDVAELTKTSLVLKRVDTATFNGNSTATTTVYTFHKINLEE